MLPVNPDRSRKRLLPRGTPVYLGRARERRPKVTLFHYGEETLEERELDDVEGLAPPEKPDEVLWVNMDGIHEVDLVNAVGHAFGIHPLVLEDVVDPGQRPKFEEYADSLYCVVKMLYRSEETKRFQPEQVSMILGPNYVLTFQEHQDGDVFDPIRERLRQSQGRIRSMGPDYLACCLVYGVVDSYFDVMESVGERLERLEAIVMDRSSPESLARLHRLRRDLIFLRRSIWPLREVIGSLNRTESELVREKSHPFYRDLYDHTIRVIDTLEAFRDMAAGVAELHLATESHRMNEVMKVLTVIATIFMPLGVIAGVYGMNFESMPELKSAWGYPAVLALMLLIAGGMAVFFRRRGWL